MTTNDINRPLYRLIYKSRTTIPGPKSSVAKAISGIAEHARRKNQAHGVTGVLLHIDDTFIQVLEGPQDRVEAVFEAICCDLRHEAIKLIEVFTVKERMFEDWAMAHVAYGGDPTRLRINRDMREIYIAIESDPGAAIEQICDLVLRDA